MPFSYANLPLKAPPPPNLLLTFLPNANNYIFKIHLFSSDPQGRLAHLLNFDMQARMQDC